MVKGRAGGFAIKAGNAQAGALTTMYDGLRPPNGYDPAHKEGAIRALNPVSRPADVNDRSRSSCSRWATERHALRSRQRKGPEHPAPRGRLAPCIEGPAARRARLSAHGAEPRGRVLCNVFPWYGWWVQWCRWPPLWHAAGVPLLTSRRPIPMRDPEDRPAPLAAMEAASPMAAQAKAVRLSIPARSGD